MNAPTDLHPQQLDRARARMTAAKRALTLATEGANSPNYLPRLLLEYKLADNHGKAELAKAMRRLRMDGKITTGTVGRYSNRNPMTGLIAVE